MREELIPGMTQQSAGVVAKAVLRQLSVRHPEAGMQKWLRGAVLLLTGELVGGESQSALCDQMDIQPHCEEQASDLIWQELQSYQQDNFIRRNGTFAYSYILKGRQTLRRRICCA